MNQVLSLYKSIVLDFEIAGTKSPYIADANEPDPRYKSYGVRAKEKKEIINKHKKAIRKLSQKKQIQLATKLIKSSFGEQQSVALFILESFPEYFSPNKMKELDELMRYISGWSKVDSFTGSLLRDILFIHPIEMIELVRLWNTDQSIWLRRMSVVLFTRKVAKSDNFTVIAQEMCNNLIFDKEPLVLKGVGWSLKDRMKTNKKEILFYVKELRKKGVSSLLTLYAIKDLKGKERDQVLQISSTNY